MVFLPLSSVVFKLLLLLLLLHLISCRSCGLYKSIETLCLACLSIKWHPIATHLCARTKKKTLWLTGWSHSIVIHYKCEVTIHSYHFSTIPQAVFFLSRFLSYFFLFSIVTLFTLSVYHVKCFRLCIFQLNVMFYGRMAAYRKWKKCWVFFVCCVFCFFVFGPIATIV